jgi:hypothetical protein
MRLARNLVLIQNALDNSMLDELVISTVLTIVQMLLRPSVR